MAATNFTPISLYYSTTAAAVPTSGNLVNGELALNTADMKLYAKNSAGTVTLLASSSGASGTVSSVAATVPSFLSIAGSPITTSGTLAISLSGTALPTTSGGTGLTSFTSGGVVYASSTSALATGSSLTFNGTSLGVGTSSITTNSKLDVTTTLNNAYSANTTYWRTSNIINASTTSGASSGIAGVVDGQAVGGVAFVRNGVANDSGSTVILYGSGTGYAEGFRIGPSGQLGIGGATYGTAGQVLTSGGSGAAPTWAAASGGASKGQAIVLSMIFG